MATVANLQRLSATALSKLLLAEEAAAASAPARPSVLAVVDVRDEDYIGGHIKGSLHVPSRTLDAMLPTLVRRLKDKQTVVFHCALSQQRGPGAALKYLRERERLAPNPAASDITSPDLTAEPSPNTTTQQTVYVLDRGFVGWQEEYGENERLTEGYHKDIWQYYEY